MKDLSCSCLPEYCSFTNCSLKQVNRTLGVVNFYLLLNYRTTDVQVI